MMTYQFATQKRQGKTVEAQLDGYFAQFFDVKPATGWQQHRGIDRVFTGRTFGQRLTVEYKADFIAADTGNCFIELRVGDRPGWAITCSADWLVYYVVGRHAYVISVALLKNRLPIWKGVHPIKTVKNTGFTAQGLVVPLPHIAEISRHIIQI